MGLVPGLLIPRPKFSPLSLSIDQGPSFTPGVIGMLFYISYMKRKMIKILKSRESTHVLQCHTGTLFNKPTKGLLIFWENIPVLHTICLESRLCEIICMAVDFCLAKKDDLSGH